MRATYYRPMLAELRRAAARTARPGGGDPVTQSHWEAAIVARQTPIARGWERQLDIKYNPLFYDDDCSPQKSYRALARRNGVSFVAVADAPLDGAGTREARLVRPGCPT